jgi:hypothetical protein
VVDPLFHAWAQAPRRPGCLDPHFDVYKAKIEPLFSRSAPATPAAWSAIRSSTNFRLNRSRPGTRPWTEEQSQKNFQMVSRFVLPGVPTKSRLLVMALAHEAGGVEFHPGGKHWQTQNDPQWKTMADWVKAAK